MKKTIRYDFILCVVVLLLFVLFSFYNTLSFGNATSELSKNGNFYDMWIYTFFVESKVFIIVCPLIILYFGCKTFHKIYHSGYIENILQRKKYNEFLNFSILNAWFKCFSFYSLYSSLILLLCLITFKNNNFSMQYLVPFGNVHPIFVYMCSFFLSIIFSIIIVNIGLFVCRYCEKFSLMIIISYLFFWGYAIFSEIIIGNIFASMITGERIVDSFSIFNMVILDGNLIVIIIYSIVLLLISTVVVKLVYKNKSEVLLSENQKN